MKTPFWLVVAIGGVIGCVAAGLAWKYTISTPALQENAKTQAQRQPTAEEIAVEVMKRIPGLIPESPQKSQPQGSRETERQPTFKEKVEEATVSLGEGGITSGVALSALETRAVEPFNFGGYKPIRMYLDKGKLFVDVSIYGGPGQAPVEVKRNEFTVRVPGWDRNFDSNALEVVNNKKAPVFQLIYRTPYHIVINGIFPSPAGLMLANDDAFSGNMPSIPKSFRILRLFKYPSNQFPSQREKVRRVIPGPDLKKRAFSISADLIFFADEREKIDFDAMRSKEALKIKETIFLTASLYDDKFALKCSGIAEEIGASGINVGRLPSHCRTANNPRSIKEVAEQLRAFAELLP